MSGTHRAPRGTFDLLPPRSEIFAATREAMAAPLRTAGYGYLETPVFEETALFARGVGESTDIVSKEMYTFITRGGESVTLRPENTAGVVRAALEAHLDRGPLPVKLWYSGSYFRYERPQKGRYRHFSQVGAEALGTTDPAIDAELIVLASDTFRSLGLTGVQLLLNSLGSPDSRASYRTALTSYLADIELDDETRRRATLNPLRVLDDSRPELREVIAAAPELKDHLSADDQAHHDAVREMLGDAGVPFTDAPRLVRGLDYYTRTTFEFVHDGLGAQSAVGGGGRYDGLSESIGGPRLPGVGWALGVDRTVLAIEAEGVTERITAEARVSCQVYLIPLGLPARRKLFALGVALRRAGIHVDAATDDRSAKAAMKAADRLGARYAVIAGDRELADGVVQLKNLTDGEQIQVAATEVAAILGRRLGASQRSSKPSAMEERNS
jgi:histidyl-tRNA synthetase